MQIVEVHNLNSNNESAYNTEYNTVISQIYAYIYEAVVCQTIILSHEEANVRHLIFLIQNKDLK